ncbi:MAG: ribonuclease PH [Coriobacteriales bacterium]|nr:ribonuclease PH [Coriobacteriales bacterium]
MADLNRIKRENDRKCNEARPIKITRNYLDCAAGSCLIEVGKTKVLCAVSIEEKVPGWMRNSNKSWITAQYSMLPASSANRIPREHLSRKGRSMEIERLIGRSMRAVADIDNLGVENTFYVDCDVIQADGGTRCASITGSYFALYDAFEFWKSCKKIPFNPIHSKVAAISAGIVDGDILLDLDYAEDSRAQVDMNIVMNDKGQYIEVQGTSESAPFNDEQLSKILSYAKEGLQTIFKMEN